jgi:hypothetical protein
LAILAGLAQACEEEIFLIDGDLAGELKWLGAFAKMMPTKGRSQLQGRIAKIRFALIILS